MTIEIFRRKPKKRAVDISENNLVELVREIRSSMGYILVNLKRSLLIVVEQSLTH